MRYDDTRLSADDIVRVGRAVDLDLRDRDVIDPDDVQRVLEGYARQSNDSLWKRAAFGSDAQFKRIVKATMDARRVYLSWSADR